MGKPRCQMLSPHSSVRTPANWIPGADVIVPPKYKEVEAKVRAPTPTTSPHSPSTVVVVFPPLYPLLESEVLLSFRWLQKKFPDLRLKKPYLRFTPLPLVATNIEKIDDISEKKAMEFLTVDDISEEQAKVLLKV